MNALVDETEAVVKVDGADISFERVGLAARLELLCPGASQRPPVELVDEGLEELPAGILAA